MCTVSFVTTSSGIVITSNRDEHVLRAAIPPQKYIYNNKPITYPKDPAAGGTWYAADGNETVLVLLNGAAKKHAHVLPYRRSRGLIVLDLISAENVVSDWDLFDLYEIEPFTIVLYWVFRLKLYTPFRSKLNR